MYFEMLLLLSGTSTQSQHMPVSVTDITAPAAEINKMRVFNFRPDSVSNEENVTEIGLLKKHKSVLNTCFFRTNSFHGLWKLGLSPPKLISLLLFTVSIRFFQFKKYLTKKDILFFKQLGTVTKHLKNVIFEDTDLEYGDVDQTCVVSSAVYLMKAKVQLYQVYGKQDQNFKFSFRINDEGYLLMFKILRSNDNLHHLMNHNAELSSNYIFKLFAGICEKNKSQFVNLRKRFVPKELRPLAAYIFRKN